MTELENYLKQRSYGLHIANPDGMRRSIVNHLRAVFQEVQNDLELEDVTDVARLRRANHFTKYYQEHLEEFRGFMKFIYDYRGWYDSDRSLYNWCHLEAYVYMVFKFAPKLSGKFRLLEITGQIQLARFAMHDPEVCNYVLQNFQKVTESQLVFLDRHGRAQSLVEVLYTALYEEKCRRTFVLASPQWCLWHVLLVCIYPEGHFSH